MIKINKNYKEYKNGVKPVYEEPKRIYYKVDSKYREVFTVFESKALYNLDIAKRNMVNQEKKTRYIISTISKLNSKITGKDQYDNDVVVAAEPYELNDIYSKIRIQELRLIIALAEEIIRTRQYKKQYLDILYKRVVLRGLQSLTRLRDIALTYNKEGFQNHKVIRVEPLTIGEGTAKATKRLDERINLVIRHNIDTADNEQAQTKILNYGGIYYRVIDSGELANISPDGLSGIDNEEYLISSFQRRLNKEAFDAGEFPSNYAIKVMTPAAAYEEIWLWTMYGLRLVENELETIKDQNDYVIDKGKVIKDAAKELEDLGELAPDDGDIIKEDQGVGDIQDILEREEVEAIEKGEKEPTPEYEKNKELQDLIDSKKDILNNIGDKITIDKDKVQTKPEEILDNENEFLDKPLHDKDNNFDESFAAGITHKFKTTDLFVPFANPERIINTFIPSVDAANPVPKKQGLFNLATLHTDVNKTYEKLLFTTESGTEYIIVGSKGKLAIVTPEVNLTTLLDTGDNGAYIINVSANTTYDSDDTELFTTSDTSNYSDRLIINTSGLNKNYTEFIDPDGDGPLPEEEQVIPPEDYFDYNIKETDLSQLFTLNDNHPILIALQDGSIQEVDLTNFLIPRADTLEKANKIRFNDEYFDLFRPVSTIFADDRKPGTSKFNPIETAKLKAEYLSNGLEAHYVNVIQQKEFVPNDDLNFVNGIFSPIETSKFNTEYLSNGLEAHYVNVIQQKEFIPNEDFLFNIKSAFNNTNESIKENAYTLSSNISLTGLEDIKGLTFQTTGLSIPSGQVNIPMAIAKPKIETIINDIQLKELDRLIFDNYLNELVYKELSITGEYDNSWLYFNVDVRDRAGESVIVNQEKISIITPIRTNVRDFSDIDIDSEQHQPTNEYDITRTASNLIKDYNNFDKNITLYKVRVQDPSIPTKGYSYNRNIPDYVNSIKTETENISSLFRINEKTKDSPIDWYITKYNRYNSSRIPNSYVTFDNGVNKDNSVIRNSIVVGMSDAENN